MPFLRIAASLLVLLWIGTAQALTVVTWNLEWFPGRSPRANDEARQKHMEAAQKVLKELNPDIFLAEEIADWSAFQKLVSVVPKLQPHIVSSFRDAFGVTHQQVAIASKLPADSAWSESWKHGWAGPPRGYSFAAIATKGGNLLMVYALHLKSNLAKNEMESTQDIAKREDSAEQLLAHVKDMEKVYDARRIRGWIVGGDFNTNTDDPQFASEGTIRNLEKAGFWNCWHDVKRKDRLSWLGSSRFPATTFDFFLLKNLGEPHARLWETSAEASDHKPVVIQLPD